MTTSTYFAPGLFRPRGLMRQHSGNMGARFRGVIAQEFDNFTVATQLVQDAGNVLLCDESVLPQHALDRGIRRYATESELSWRTRLSKGNQIWQSAGTAWGILRQLRIMLLPHGRPRLRHVSTSGDGAMSQWYTLEPGDGTVDYFETNPYDRPLDPEFSRYLAKPGNFLWDAGASSGEWSRFVIAIELAGLTSPDVTAGEWDGASTWDGSYVWDGGLSGGVIDDIVALCNDWKFAGSQLKAVLFVPDEMVLSPTGTSVTLPAGQTTYPNGQWDDPTKRNPDVIFAYVHP